MDAKKNRNGVGRTMRQKQRSKHPEAKLFKLNLTQQDENSRPRTSWANNYLSAFEEEECDLREILNIDSNKKTIPVREYLLLKAAANGAVTVEDFIKEGVPRPPLAKIRGEKKSGIHW